MVSGTASFVRPASGSIAPIGGIGDMAGGKPGAGRSDGLAWTRSGPAPSSAGPVSAATVEGPPARR